MVVCENLISFVIPCYRSENTIEFVTNEIIETMAKRPEYDYEIICVNDCSPDALSVVLGKIAHDNKKIKVIEFSKNRGKHAAVLAGHSYVSGEYVVDLDDDGQCPVSEGLWKLVDQLRSDACDMVMANYFRKKESLFKRFGSAVNYKMTNALLSPPMGLRFENFSVMKRFVSDEIIKYRNPYPYVSGLILSVTHRINVVMMEERERADSNTSGFTFKRSLHLWLNGLTSFSEKPLRIATYAGFIFAAIGFIYGLYTIIRKLIDPSILMGYSSLVAILLFATGMIMLMLGMLGEYVGRIYVSLNSISQYTIRNTINIDDAEPDASVREKEKG